MSDNWLIEAMSKAFVFGTLGLLIISFILGFIFNRDKDFFNKDLLNSIWRHLKKTGKN